MNSISNFGSPRLRTTMGAALMLSLLVGGGTACADKTSGTLLGAGLGAVGGAAIGYAAGGSDGALIGAAAGAVVGGIAGYALSGKKETVRKEESVVRQEVAATAPAAVRQNIVEVRDVGVWPSRVAPGQTTSLNIAMRAVGDGSTPLYPPKADVAIYQGEKLIHNEEVPVDNTGDVDISVNLPIPDAAEAGTYKVVVAAKPDPRTTNPQPPNSSRQSTFEVVQATAFVPAGEGRVVAVK
jgi:hypothetical protein